VVEEEGDGWQEMEEIEASGGREKEREGVYPPAAMESVRKTMKMKGMKDAPLDDNGDEGTTSD
jgi:hypothetical protein